VALNGHTLVVRRDRPGSYFGAAVPKIGISGSDRLKVAFVVRPTGMRDITINLFDDIRQDNTTSASPARVVNGQWQPVVFNVQAFHYNSQTPDRTIPAQANFSSLMIHGQADGPAPEFWIDNLVVYRGIDATPPGPPGEVRATPAASGVELQWIEPPDDTFAVLYSVYRRAGEGAWTKVGETAERRFLDAVPEAGTYQYRVTAADFENNVSAPSSDVLLTAVPSGGAGPAPDEADWVVDRKAYAAHVRAIHERGRGTVRPGVFLFAGDSITAATLYARTMISWLGRGLMVRQGVGQITTAYGAANIREYLASGAPEFALVMYGTNDDKGGRAVTGAMRNLASIVDACVERGTIPILATIPPRGYSKGGQGEQERFNRALIELARQKQIPVSYAFEEMMQRDLRQILYDGIHLEPRRGNEAAAMAFRRTMDQVYFALRDTSGGW
jgi:hypothetical protein